LANHKSTIKRIRSDERKRVRNRMARSRTRTFVKHAHTAIQSGDRAAAETAAKQAIKELDKAVTKGVIHPNNAARHKSRLMKQLNAMS
jgi:small subunit ribosomal protein S20